MTRDRFPRTLSEAFGPYTSSHFESERHCFFRALGAWLVSLLRRSQ
jgi:hypothetical protein